MVVLLVLGIDFRRSLLCSFFVFVGSSSISPSSVIGVICFFSFCVGDPFPDLPK